MVHIMYVLDSVVLINTFFFFFLAVLWHSAFQLLRAIPNPCFITTQKCLQCLDKTSLDASVIHPVIQRSHLRHRNVYYVNIENVYDRKIGNVCIHFLEKHFTLHTP